MRRFTGLAKGLLGLDFHVLNTIALRSWGIAAGFLTTLLLPIFLTGQELGYYFAFASILALQIFFELGFNQVVTLLAGHEAAELSVDDIGGLCGEESRLGRLASLSSLTNRWYLFSAIAFVLIVAPTGFFFFSQSKAVSVDAWLAPWLVLVCATGVNLYLSPRLAILEGCGRVGSVAQLRLASSIIGYIFAWLVLALDGGLWAIVCVPISSFLSTIYWLKCDRYFPRDFRKSPASLISISWRHEILPLQWRISLSWVSGYFIFNLFTPLIFATSGAVAAGRFGLSMSILSGLSTVSMSWMYARVPQFSRLAARHDLNGLRQLFAATAMRSVGTTVIMCCVFLGLAWCVSSLHPPLGAKLLDLLDLSLLMAAVIANAVISSAAIFMRSFRQEPMLPVSMGTAVLCCAALYFGSGFGVRTMVALYSGITVFIALPWTLLVFRQHFRRRLEAKLVEEL